MRLISKSISDTQKIAKILVAKLNRKPVKRVATVLALEGELGAGKTVLAKAIAKQLGVKQTITSPTFVLMKQYKVPQRANSKMQGARERKKESDYLPFAFSSKLLVHIDAYRLKDYRDLELLGIKEILANPENLVLIEWSDRVRKITPKSAIKVHIDHIGESERVIKVND